MKKELKVKYELPSVGKIYELASHPDSKQLLEDISCLVESSRHRLAQSVNSELVLLYWQIGRRISEDLPAENRAEYGARIVELVSERLTAEYGKGFRRSNVFHMIRFAEAFDDVVNGMVDPETALRKAARAIDLDIADNGGYPPFGKK